MTTLDKHIIDLENTFKKNIIVLFQKLTIVKRMYSISIGNPRVSPESDFDTFFVLHNISNKDIHKLKYLLSFFYIKYSALFAHKTIIIPETLFSESKAFATTVYFSKKSAEISPAHKEKVAFQFFLTNLEWTIRSYLQYNTLYKQGVSEIANKLFESAAYQILVLRHFNKRSSFQPDALYGSREYIDLVRKKVREHQKIDQKQMLDLLKQELIASAKQLNQILKLNNSISFQILTHPGMSRHFFISPLLYKIRFFKQRSRFFDSSLLVYCNALNNSQIIPNQENNFYIHEFNSRKKFLSEWTSFLKEYNLFDFCDPRIGKFHPEIWKSVYSLKK